MLSNHEEKIELPAEWETQSATLLTWPHAYSDWKNNLLEIEAVYIQICKAISSYQKLFIICYDEMHQAHIKEILINNSLEEHSFHLIVCKTNDTWCRDYGPLTTRCDGSLQVNNFYFNGWGDKYDSALDNLVSTQLYRMGLFEGTQFIDRKFVLEGGSIDTDGHGALLTTSHCLLKRHPHKDKPEIEMYLKKHLGAVTVHWLDHGAISGDDTDSHIDNLARFVSKDTIVYCACDNETHPDYESLHQMKKQLQVLKQANSNTYKLIPIYMPSLIQENGRILPASYMNFLIINQAVLVPVYAVPQDNAALETLKQCFPDREIIDVDATALIKQSGSLHCATMQIPAGLLN